MSISVKPETLQHLFYMAQGTGAWQHFNYYLQHYTDHILMEHREDTDTVGSLYCMVNKDEIVRVLALDIFGTNLEFIEQ